MFKKWFKDDCVIFLIWDMESLSTTQKVYRTEQLQDIALYENVDQKWKFLTLSSSNYTTL